MLSLIDTTVAGPLIPCSPVSLCLPRFDTEDTVNKCLLVSFFHCRQVTPNWSSGVDVQELYLHSIAAASPRLGQFHCVCPWESYGFEQGLRPDLKPLGLVSVCP